MRLSPLEIHGRVSEAVSRLQDDDGVFRRFIEKHHLDRVEFWLVARFRYFPGSVTANDFVTFGPYTSVSIYQDALNALAEKDMVNRVGEGRYKLAAAMRKALGETYQEFFARVARTNALPDEDAAWLYASIDRVYTAALRQSEVPTPILNAAHSVLPESDSTWVQLERRLVGLMIFHDEAHIAAWREAGYTGPRVEVSTALFRAGEEPLSYDELRQAAERLDDKDFTSALSALHAGGEVTQREERYRLSASGRAAREEIEAATDRHYARPFATLGDEELDRVARLLDALAAGTE